MKIAFDIGGVISKEPQIFKELMNRFKLEQVYVITDMHNKEEIFKLLCDNNISVYFQHIYCADYAKYGEMCKAILLKELSIDIFIDDFVGYLSWDSSLGKAPIRLLMMPDVYSPYWHSDWKVPEESDFGRRKYSVK